MLTTGGKIWGVKRIARIYRQGVKENILGVKSILKQLEMEEPPLSLYEGVLARSSDQIVSNWLSGRKYARTLFVQKAFGKLYPTKYTEFSLCIDAIVNILDDFFDEALDRRSGRVCR